MVRVGIAGIGFMGWIHYLAYQAVEGVELGAICSRDPKKLSGDWTSIQGNFGPPGEQVDLSDVSTYESLEAMLADDSLDLIDICLPPAMHAAAASAVLKSGKHVFCEKPMALTISDCNEMVKAAEAADKRLLIGHVLPFLPEYQIALQAKEDGRYGKLLGGSFKRIISDPTWLSDFYNPSVVGGPLIDLHVHDAHFIRVLFGMPAVVTSTGRMRGEVVEFCQSLFEFEDPALVVHSTGGVVQQQGRPFTHGYEIHFEEATLHFEFAIFSDDQTIAAPLRILHSDGTITQPDLGEGDTMVQAFQHEVQEVLNSISQGKNSAVLGGELAKDAIRLCDAQTDAVKQKEKITLND